MFPIFPIEKNHCRKGCRDEKKTADRKSLSIKARHPFLPRFSCYYARPHFRRLRDPEPTVVVFRGAIESERATGKSRDDADNDAERPSTLPDSTGLIIRRSLVKMITPVEAGKLDHRLPRPRGPPKWPLRAKARPQNIRIARARSLVRWKRRSALVLSPIFLWRTKRPYFALGSSVPPVARSSVAVFRP